MAISEPESGEVTMGDPVTFFFNASPNRATFGGPLYRRVRQYLVYSKLCPVSAKSRHSGTRDRVQ